MITTRNILTWTVLHLKNLLNLLGYKAILIVAKKFKQDLDWISAHCRWAFIVFLSFPHMVYIQNYYKYSFLVAKMSICQSDCKCDYNVTLNFCKVPVYYH